MMITPTILGFKVIVIHCDEALQCNSLELVDQPMFESQTTQMQWIIVYRYGQQHALLDSSSLYVKLFVWSISIKVRRGLQNMPARSK